MRAWALILAVVLAGFAGSAEAGGGWSIGWSDHGRHGSWFIGYDRHRGHGHTSFGWSAPSWGYSGYRDYGYYGYRRPAYPWSGCGYGCGYAYYGSGYYGSGYYGPSYYGSGYRSYGHRAPAWYGYRYSAPSWRYSGYRHDRWDRRDHWDRRDRYDRHDRDHRRYSGRYSSYSRDDSAWQRARRDGSRYRSDEWRGRETW